MFESNMYVLDESKASAWERSEVLDEQTGEPTGEHRETRVVPAAHTDGGHRHYAFQTRSVGAPRSMEDWRLQQAGVEGDVLRQPWYVSERTHDDEGNVNGWFEERLTRVSGRFYREIRYVDALQAA